MQGCQVTILPERRSAVRRLIRSHDEGFTLIELLIVVAILAILVSIVTISFGDIMESTDEAAKSTELQLVQLTVDRYNSWDVYVLAASEIVANPTAVRLPDASAAFSKYLATDTRFCYTWGAKGASLASQKCTTP